MYIPWAKYFLVDKLYDEKKIQNQMQCLLIKQVQSENSGKECGLKNESDFLLNRNLRQ